MIERPDAATVLVGTAHVSPRSVEEVRATILAERPDEVHVELDAKRLEALRDPERWRNTDLMQVIREKKQHLFLVQLYLANLQARVGKSTGSAPGAEMLAAIQAADEVGADVVLIDRDVSVTLKRGFGSMGFWRRLRLLWNLWMEFFTPARAAPPMDIDKLLETDAITHMTQEFARIAPELKVALIDERDAVMADHVLAARRRGRRVVAVVGAGHVAGMLAHLRTGHVEIAGRRVERQELEQPPPPRFGVALAIAWGIPLLVVVGFAYLALEGRLDDVWTGLGLWAVITGAGAAIGAAAALGHPWSVLTAAAAAPITTLHPALAAGWFAGLVEAKVRTPRVGDFEAIKHMDSFRAFWMNPVVRVLLVTALANLGAMVGMWIASARLAGTIFGAS